MYRITAAVVAAAILAGAPAPATAAGRGTLIKEHACTRGVAFGGGITGWLYDLRTERGVHLRYLNIDNATNGTWDKELLYSCRR